MFIVNLIIKQFFQEPFPTRPSGNFRSYNVSFILFCSYKITRLSELRIITENVI